MNTMTADNTAKLGKQALKTLVAREKILNAVISLINEGGFGAATSSRISGAAGAAPKTRGCKMPAP